MSYEDKLDAVAESIQIERMSDNALKAMFEYGGTGEGCHTSSWGKIWDAVQDYRDACYL